jgi:uncharacterized integral membrane protein
MVLFSVQNAAPVVVSFLSWKLEASLAVIIVLSVLIGILIGGRRLFPAAQAIDQK